MSNYTAIIGLECHAQLHTQAKMFCPCPVADGAAPNSAVCPICLGHPGTLPTVNDAAIKLAIRAALATGATLHSPSTFARKHYFYPDLPKGYQISQFDRPFATGGAVHGGGKRFRIHQIHLEEDAGKMHHTATGSLVDWNRAGVPLIEIVSEADIQSAEEAEAYLRTLHRVLVEGGICVGDLEKGHFRCDANVSVHHHGEPWGTKVEIKNVNSFRFVAKAIGFEILRQVQRLESGNPVERETRTWSGNKTVVLRKKEGPADYRYFDEPDLGPLLLGAEEIAAERAALPGIPLDVYLEGKDRDDVSTWVQQFGIEADAVRVIRAHPDTAMLFEAAVLAGGSAPAMATWIMGEVLRHPGIGRLTGVHLRDVQAMAEAGTINRDAAKRVVEALWATGGTAQDIVSQQSLGRVDDPAEITTAVRALLAKHPDQVGQYREGNVALLGYFMGKLMAATRRRADPAVALRLLKAALDTPVG